MGEKPDSCPRVCTPESLVRAMPPGPERDQVLALLRFAIAFKAQHAGRRPGFLAKEIARIVEKIGDPVTFERVLDEIELATVRRDRDGNSAFEQVNRVWSLVTYHDPRRGRVQVTFATIRNKVTACKKICRREFPGTAIP